MIENMAALVDRCRLKSCGFPMILLSDLMANLDLMAAVDSRKSLTV